MFNWFAGVWLVCLGWWCGCRFGFVIVLLFVICLCALWGGRCAMVVCGWGLGGLVVLVCVRGVVLCFTFVTDLLFVVLFGLGWRACVVLIACVGAWL